MSIFSFRSAMGDSPTFITREEFEAYKRKEEAMATHRLIKTTVLSNLVGIVLSATAIGAVGIALTKAQKR